MKYDERLRMLENHVKNLHRVLFGLVMLFIAGVVITATSLQSIPDVIQAKSFEVISDDGKAVVVLNSIRNEPEVPLHEPLHYGSITSLNSNGNTLVTMGASPCAGTGQLLTMNAYGRLLVKIGAEFDTLRYGVVGNGGVVQTYQENGTLTSYLPADEEQAFRDPYTESTRE